jgi:hypothetical protein
VALVAVLPCWLANARMSTMQSLHTLQGVGLQAPSTSQVSCPFVSAQLHCCSVLAMLHSRSTDLQSGVALQRPGGRVPDCVVPGTAAPPAVPSTLHLLNVVVTLLSVVGLQPFSVLSLHSPKVEHMAPANMAIHQQSAL